MKPNILFLCIDSLGADKCYGDNKTSKTPNIDSLIKNGVYFNQTISSANLTILASSSILTGCYPFKALINDREHGKLLSNVVTYVDLLRNFGYHTHSSIPKIIDLSGLAKSFEDKHAPDFTELILSTGFGQQIVEKLESKKMQEPWFFYIHISDLHDLPSLPEEFNHEKFGMNQYERTVSYLDFWIGKILQKIQLEKTIVILTADHGPHFDTKQVFDFEEKARELISNSFWFKPNLSRKLFFFRSIIEKCSFISKSIITQIKIAQIKRLKIPLSEKRDRINALTRNNAPYDNSICVPLIFSGYKIPKGIMIKQQTRSIDIFPTIADLIGLPKRKDKIHGISLIPYFQGTNMEELPVRIETAPKWLNYFGTNQMGIRTSEYKYFRNRDNPQKDVYLFNLKNDPFEEKNIAKHHPAIVQKMENLLSEFNNDDISMDELEDMNEETKERIEAELKKLGYI